MKCPKCGLEEDKVLESRSTEDNEAVRRRRECLSCGTRFTSYERIEESHLMVIKKDNRRESYDRKKIFNGIRRACEKRPISTDQIESMVEKIEKEIFKLGREIPTEKIGSLVIENLKNLDQVAYVRFASVYKEFKDVDEFVAEIKIMDKEGVAI